MERKFHGSESSLCGLFAPWNESAEERKGLESFILPHPVEEIYPAVHTTFIHFDELESPEVKSHHMGSTFKLS